MTEEEERLQFPKKAIAGSGMTNRSERKFTDRYEGGRGDEIAREHQRKTDEMIRKAKERNRMKEVENG